MNFRVAIRYRLLSRPAVLAAHAVGLVVLSRLLSAADFGLFALAAVAHQIAVAIADLGIKSQLLKSTELETHRHGEALGLAMVSATIVTLCFVIVILSLPDELAPPALDVALYILAASVLMGPLDLLFNIPLMQSMRFGLISGVNIAGAWTRCGVSIGVALLGAGPAALAAGLLAEQLVSFVVFACAKRKEAIPTLRATGWRTLIADGARLSIGQVIWRLCELGMMGAISGFLGAAALGIYNRANQVVRLFDTVFISSIEPVVLPGFAQIIKRGHHPASIYVRKVELLSATTWPAFAVIAILAEPLCSVILGPSWPEATVIVQLLALAGLAKPFAKMSQTLFIALGELRLGTRLDIQHHITLATLASAGAFISLQAACFGLVIGHFINATRQTRAFKRLTGYEPAVLQNVLLRSALLTVCAVGPAALTVYALGAHHDVIVLIVAGTAAIAGYIIAAILMRHTLTIEAQKALKSLSGKRSNGG